MHTGCQWEEIPIEKDESGKPEIHFRSFQLYFEVDAYRMSMGRNPY